MDTHSNNIWCSYEQEADKGHREENSDEEAGRDEEGGKTG